MITGQDNLSPPAADEIEISLFGPGFGECCVIHVGNGSWVVIDSCLNDETRQPAALDYFKKINVDPATAISHVVVSHPDDDHVGGISEVYRAAENAELVMSCAFTERAMLAYTMQFAQPDPSQLVRATAELADVLATSKSRGRIPHFAIQDQLLHQSGNVTLSALAPSHQKMQQFIQKLVRPRRAQDKLRPAGLDPNPASVVVHLKSPDCIAIFGGDLEETPGKGWTDMMASSIVFKNSGQALIFKVPHHGSENAHLAALWKHFGKQVIAILTNFNSGKKHLPSPQDVERILGYTDNAYICSSRHGIAPKKDRIADKGLKLVGIGRRRRYSRDGQIRIRIQPGAAPKLDLFGAAAHLAELDAVA